jgi:protein-S-isoprenylcysteine O-methyltransferase Ste14
VEALAALDAGCRRQDDTLPRFAVKLLYWTDVTFYLCFSAYVIYVTPFSIRFLAGLFIAAAGFILWMLARYQLGSSFSVRAQARTLVTKGLYSKIRHPIYFFGAFAFGGMFIAWGKLFPLIGFCIVYSSQLLRVLKEEKVLEDAFGDDYRRYKASTWF